MMVKKQTAVKVTAYPRSFLIKQIYDLFRYYFSSPVITTMRAYPVGKSFFAAVAALDQLFRF
jgi:hypothetical protein